MSQPPSHLIQTTIISYPDPGGSILTDFLSLSSKAPVITTKHQIKQPCSEVSRALHQRPSPLEALNYLTSGYSPDTTNSCVHCFSSGRFYRGQLPVPEMCLLLQGLCICLPCPDWSVVAHSFVSRTPVQSVT